MQASAQANSENILQLPQDVLVNICQRLLEAKDLLRFGQCSRGCWTLVDRVAIWRSLLLARFGDQGDSKYVPPSSSLQDLKKCYAHLSRILVPAEDLVAVHSGTRYLSVESLQRTSYSSALVLCLHNVCWLDIYSEFKGVLPGKYRVVWRMMKTAQQQVGWPASTIQCSAEVQATQPLRTKWTPTNGGIVHHMQAVNELPRGEWTELSGGEVAIEDFAHVSVRMWCHSGEWKSGLMWEHVRLLDLSQSHSEPVLASADAAQPDVVQRASDAVHAAVQSAQAVCRTQ